MGRICGGLARGRPPVDGGPADEADGRAAGAIARGAGGGGAAAGDAAGGGAAGPRRALTGPADIEDAPPLATARCPISGACAGVFGRDEPDAAAAAGICLDGDDPTGFACDDDGVGAPALGMEPDTGGT